MSNEKRWVIVSNRLPVHFDKRRRKFIVSSGGLVSSLLGVDYQRQVLWLGLTTEQWDTDEIASALGVNSHIKIVPLTIPEELYHAYYNKFCNEVLWPLLHYENHSVNWDADAWKKYQEVNRLVASSLLKLTNAHDDLLWIHDFHLMLVAEHLRLKRRRQGIGFFLHVPFPSYEIFRQLPHRSTLLRAMLSYDLIGFHDYNYLMHFSQTVQYVLGITAKFNCIDAGGRSVKLGVYPVSIPTQVIHKSSRSKKVKETYNTYSQRYAKQKVVLGVDRLDYIKGIDLKLEIFHTFLEKYAEYHGKVTLLQIVVPSRTEVPLYMELKKNIEGKVGFINGHWGKADYTPVNYIYDSVQSHELLAMYQLSDCLLITSKRDGMNLVALEYIAAQIDERPGQVLLSEFAGAISIMPNAIAINPWHIDKSAERLYHALKEQAEVVVARNQQMFTYLKTYTGNEWAKSYINDLGKSSARKEQVALPVGKALITKIKNWQRKYLFLDYDGTLTPIYDYPEQALLSDKITELLATLRKQGIGIVIVSGRGRKFLWQQFKQRRIMLVAEHGAEFYDNKSWKKLVNSPKDEWFTLALQIMHYYGQRVPSSVVEVKDYSICWHYRNSPAFYSTYQARKLTEELEFGLASFPVEVSNGKKIVEAKALEANKGKFVRWFCNNYLHTHNANIIAIGDDITDEDLFADLRPDDISIKVGTEETKAKYRLHTQKEVYSFLQSLVKENEKSITN